MNNIPIFALEGFAFAGKTTLIDYLKKNFSSKIVVIPEASEYIGGDQNLPDLPFKNYEEAKTNTYFFVEIEKKRCRDALIAYKKTGLPVLIDRSTPISSLFFYLMLKYTNFQDPVFIDKVYQHALEAFQAQVDTGNIIIPGKLIYLKPSSQKVFTQRLERGTKNNVFTSWKNFNFLDRKYHTLITKHYPNGNSITLESENSHENLEYIAKLTLDFIKRSRRPEVLNNIFHNFLDEKRDFILDITSDEEINKYSKNMEKAKRLIQSAKIRP